MLQEQKKLQITGNRYVMNSREDKSFLINFIKNYLENIPLLIQQ